MQSSMKRAKVLSALSVAAAAGLGMVASQAHAVTLTSYYANGIVSTVSPIATGTATPTSGKLTIGVNATVVDISASTPTITVPTGDYIQYGVAAAVTNNINLDGGIGTATGPSSGSSIIQPTNLGLADIGYRVLNVSANNSTGSLLAPVQGATRGVNQFNSVAVIGGKGKVTGSAIASNYVQNANAGAFGTTDLGDVEPGSPAVGTFFQIFQGNPSATGETTGAQISLTAFAFTNAAGTGVANPHNATLVFDTLGYQAGSTGATVTLQPAIDPGATQYWSTSVRGNSTTAPTQYQATFFSSADTIVPLPVLTVVITGGTTTTPTSTHAIINLSAAANTTYAPSLGKLTVTGGHGSYTLQQLTGLTAGIGTVEANGFNPATDTELYALDVLVNGTQANATQIGTLLSRITADGLQAGVLASSSLAVDPFPGNYNLFLTVTGAITGTGDNFLGFDLTSANDAALVGYTTSAVAVVPEPMSLGMLALGGVSLLARRRNKVQA
jgi:hypothetical protein